VLDANSDIQAEKDTFSRAYTDLYGNTLQYVPNAEVLSVNSYTGQVYTSAGDFQGDVVNVIPGNQATSFVRDSGLTNYGDWAPVDPTTYESTLSGFSGVHIIGDSQNTNQPKSAHMANSQAKVCADAIVRSISGLPTDTTERLDNITTNSACYSPILQGQASWLSANFSYNRSAGQMELKHMGASGDWSSKNYNRMFKWANGLFSDCFG
jgi:NADH dehydrogenase FAD-containing subunit